MFLTEFQYSLLPHWRHVATLTELFLLDISVTMCSGAIMITSLVLKQMSHSGSFTVRKRSLSYRFICCEL